MAFNMEVIAILEDLFGMEWGEREKEIARAHTLMDSFIDFSPGPYKQVNMFVTLISNFKISSIGKMTFENYALCQNTCYLGKRKESFTFQTKNCNKGCLSFFLGLAPSQTY